MTYKSADIGARIRQERENFPKEHRKRKGISQSELAQRLGYAADYRQLVANWESGAKLPSLEDLVKLCELFECEMGYLLCQPDYILKTGRKTDIQKATGLSKESVNAISNLDFVVGNRHFAEFENGTLSSRHILSQIIADDRMRQVLIASKQAKTLKYSLQKKVEPDVDAEDFSQALFTLNEMNMVALRPDDSVKFYIQEAGRIFMDILHTIVDEVTDNESYSTERVSLDPDKTIIKWSPDVWIVNDKTATKPTPAP